MNSLKKWESYNHSIHVTGAYTLSRLSFNLVCFEARPKISTVSARW